MGISFLLSFRNLTPTCRTFSGLVFFVSSKCCPSTVSAASDHAGRITCLQHLTSLSQTGSIIPQTVVFVWLQFYLPNYTQKQLLVQSVCEIIAPVCDSDVKCCKPTEASSVINNCHGGAHSRWTTAWCRSVGQIDIYACNLADKTAIEEETELDKK